MRQLASIFTLLLTTAIAASGAGWEDQAMRPAERLAGRDDRLSVGAGPRDLGARVDETDAGSGLHDLVAHDPEDGERQQRADDPEEDQQREQTDD